MVGFIVTKIVSLFILPPGGALLLMFIGLCLVRHFRALAISLLISGVALLYASSMPLVANSIRPNLDENLAVVSQDEIDSAAAIVILGGGLYANAPEYGEDTIAGQTLERTRYGAYLHRLSGKPLLVTGGRPKQTELSEAEAMRNVLESEFGVAVRWVEDSALNTRDNAELSRTILEADGIHDILLVTHAFHMTRAVNEFERVGFRVIPASTKFRVKPPLSFFDFLPSASALSSTARSLHEWLGMAWYAISR